MLSHIKNLTDLKKNCFSSILLYSEKQLLVCYLLLYSMQCFIPDVFDLEVLLFRMFVKQTKSSELEIVCLEEFPSA